MRLLKFFFYRFYQLLNNKGNEDFAEYYAIMIIAFIFGVNIFTVQLLSLSLLNYKIDFGLNSGLKIGIVFGLLVIILYFMLLNNKKHLLIIKNYEAESGKNRLTGKYSAIAYIIISLLLWGLSMYLMILKNTGKL